ncbi:LuxR family transcriptional regulator [Amylibacter sp. SFDW26]|uniref:helix-turn-helix transcriptional regulator n=1 Tax=Amylibacter sp. SFDW26 TaxID=2652722 RepID=UPI0012617472|nr:autoinducer binding domain-containing protein [Amylibacter sp. SFDW26]KAB7613279.1 LuxR family transcriptional regulator [Amylibacter sp. SFDW26]
MADKSNLDSELKKLEEISPLGYSIGLHIRFASPLISSHTWSKKWQDHYTNNVYGLRDPMVAWSFAKQGVCRWNECPLPDPFDIIKQAREHGLKHGATISHGRISSRSIVGIAREDREFTIDELLEAQKIVMDLHRKAELPARLTDAQREALELVADGYRYEMAAAKLGISVSAFKVRLFSARSRLLAKTTAEAVQRAKDYKLL